MSTNIVWEIGKNHKGSFDEAKKLISAAGAAGASAISLQIRESTFYSTHPNLKFSMSEYKTLFKLSRDKGMSIYLALGPITDYDLLEELFEHIDGVKLLYMTLLEKDIADYIYKKAMDKNLSFYFSTGALDIQKTKSFATRYKNAKILHTKLSHEIIGQEISNIHELSKLGYHCAFGQHCENWAAVSVAIGAGAKQIFIYFGDKQSTLPDHEHAVDISEIPDFLKYVDDAYSSLMAYKGNEIEFIG